MARTAKPWFNREKNWWMVWLNGKQTKLAEGRRAKKAAESKLLELRFEASKNPHPEGDRQTVASVIESYLSIEGGKLAESTRDIHTHYLQSFADLHGWRPVNQCDKKHVTSWVQGHPEWKSDWTIA